MTPLWWEGGPLKGLGRPCATGTNAGGITHNPNSGSVVANVEQTAVFVTNVRGRLFPIPYTGAMTRQFAAALGVTGGHEGRM